MALDLSSILPLFAQTAWVAVAEGVTPQGDTIFGEPVAFKARIDPTDQVVTNKDGEDDAASFELITAQPIGKKDKLWVGVTSPDDEGDGRMAKRIEPLIDETGAVVLYEVLV